MTERPSPNQRFHAMRLAAIERRASVADRPDDPDERAEQEAFTRAIRERQMRAMWNG